MRRPASPVAALPPFLLLLAVAGCARAGGAAGPPTKPAESAVRADVKGRRNMLVVRNQKAVEVASGTLIDLVVTRPVAAPRDLQLEWPASPAIERDAVRFLRLRIENPPPDVDGGVTTHHYELEAAKPGTARVTLAPISASPESAHPPVRVDVTVTAARRPQAGSTTP